MKVTTSKDFRKKTLLELSPDKFESYFDYYVFIHLNSKVVIMHSIGMILGFIFLGLALYHWSWIYLLAHLICFNVIPLVSHIIFDGINTPTATGAPLVSIWYAIKINMWYLTGRQKKNEAEFIRKYPFTKKFFREN